MNEVTPDPIEEFLDTLHDLIRRAKIQLVGDAQGRVTLKLDDGRTFGIGAEGVVRIA